MRFYTEILRCLIFGVVLCVMVSCRQTSHEDREETLVRYLKECRIDTLEYQEVAAHSIVADAHKKGNEALCNAGCECGFSVILQSEPDKTGVPDWGNSGCRYSLLIRNYSVYDTFLYIGKMIHADVSYDTKTGTFYFKCRRVGGKK